VARRSFSAHLARATHAGHVGESSKISRGWPLNVLNPFLSLSTPRSCDSVSAAGATFGVISTASANTATIDRMSFISLPPDQDHYLYLPRPISGQYNGTSSSRISAVTIDSNAPTFNR